MQPRRQPPHQPMTLTTNNPCGRLPHSFPPHQQPNPKLRTKTHSFPPPEKNEKRKTNNLYQNSATNPPPPNASTASIPSLAPAPSLTPCFLPCTCALPLLPRRREPIFLLPLPPRTTLVIPAEAGIHLLLLPLPSWERIEVRVIGVAAVLTGKLCRSSQSQDPIPHTPPVGAVREPPAHPQHLLK